MQIQTLLKNKTKKSIDQHDANTLSGTTYVQEILLYPCILAVGTCIEMFINSVNETRTVAEA